MDRAKATKQLERIIGAIEDGAFLVPVKELHVFGSYARGAMNPGDLDLILIHEPAPKSLMDRIEAEVVEKYGDDILYWRVMPKDRFTSLMCKPMRRPGEKMDIMLGTTLEEVLSPRPNVANSARVLVWSEGDRDWRTKLDSIKPDPSAGRHDRGHFAMIKRFRCNLRTMEHVSEAIRQDVVKLMRIPVESIKLTLNPLYQQRLDWWVEYKVTGKDSMKLLPHGLWWLQQQKGQKSKPPDAPSNDAVMTSEDYKFAVYFGRPRLTPVFSVARGQRYKKVCLIPHFKRDLPSELLEFERGANYSKEALDKILDANRFAL